MACYCSYQDHHKSVVSCTSVGWLKKISLLLVVTPVYLSSSKAAFMVCKDIMEHVCWHTLLLSYQDPHISVVSCTIVGWVKKLLAAAGSNTSISTAHSTSSSKALSSI